jgi:hypothetical protein
MKNRLTKKLVKIVRKIYSRIPSSIFFIMTWWIISRLFLTFIGTFSRRILEIYFRADFPGKYSKLSWLDIWGVWDSGWYLNIAQQWYQKASLLHQAKSNINFFPLYPLLMKIGGFFGNHYFIAGVVISNLCLIVALYVLYQMVREKDNEDTARRTVKFVILAPASFILSGVFTESLFLMLAIFTLFCGQKHRWFLAGLCGLCLSLTKSIGVLIFIPLVVSYFQSIRFNLRRIRPPAFFLFLVPLGLFLWGLYNYWLTGDPLAFVHAQQHGWGTKANFGLVIFQALKSPYPENVVNGILAILLTLFLLVFIKKTSLVEWIYAMTIMVCILFFGVFYNSMFRYGLIIYPFYIICARLGTKPLTDQMLTAVFALLQGLFMVFWAANSPVII